MKFLIDNLLLVAIALTSGGLLLWPLIRKAGGSTALTPLLATQLINHRNAIVVDVRDEKDFALGSLAGARNIPFANLAERASELVRFKARPVLIICAAGPQSAKAIEQFAAQGFEEAHSLAGGIAAWRQAGLPLVQPTRDGKTAGRDPARKIKGDGRARTNSGKQRRDALVQTTAPTTAADIVVDPGAPEPAATSDGVAATEASTTPNRVKELS
ncbi:MAG: rhodanese-like domain-containing protein [Burkholderiaceae bacterium]